MDSSRSAIEIYKYDTDIDMGIPYQDMLESINEGICFMGTDGLVKYWNQVEERLYGIRRDEIIDSRIDKFFPNALSLSVLYSGKPAEYVAHRPREGSVLIISAVPIKKNGRILGVLSIDQDITEFRRVNEELAEAKKRIKYLEYAEEVVKKLPIRAVLAV